MNSRSVVKKYLESLGDTSEKVAQSLRDQGIKGRRNDFSRCPIARAVGSHLVRSGVELHGVNVGEVQIRWFTKRARAPEINTPPVIAKFITEFDSGKHPGLFG